MILAIALWTIAAYVVTSALEYFPHRSVMHGRWLARFLRMPRLTEEYEAHHVLHHGRFFGGSFEAPKDIDPAGRYVSIDTGALYMLSNLWWVWVPITLLSPLGGGVFAATFALHGALWSAAHREMHYPAGGWITRVLPDFYRFWHAYHETHHERPGTNFNVLFPLFDQLLGTYSQPAKK